mgnify:CR=1 FL=1
MEKDDRDRLETVITDRISANVATEREGTRDEDRGSEGDVERVRNRRRRLRRRRGSESRNSDNRDTAGASASTSTEERDDEATNIRVEQYSSEPRKSSRKKEKSQKTVKLEDAIEQFLDTTFSIVSVLSGEPHWVLDASERKMLGDAVIAYIEAQDRRTLQRLRKAAGKYFPAVNLAIVSFAIIYPRVLQSKIFVKKI